METRLKNKIIAHAQQDFSEEDSKTVQSVERALSLIEILADTREAMQLGELVAKANLKSSTVHRLLSTLIHRGFVEQDERSRYRLSMKLYHIGNAVSSATSLREIALPLMQELLERFNETVNLAVLDCNEVVYLEQLESSNLVVVRMFARVGNRGPAHCTGSGKVLLAGLDKEDLRRYLEEVELQRFTSDTITDPLILLGELQKVRADGYALDLGERDEGVRCVAAPIKNHRGKVVAALSVSGPSMRMTSSYISNELCPMVKEVAGRISRRIGYLD